MQSQSAESATDYLFKFLPWVEANLKRLALGAAVIVIAIFVVLFYSYQQSQKEIAAGQALAQVGVTENGAQLADACLKIATDYPGTLTGQRALLQGATALFTSGKYADAQTAFQKFLDAYPDNFFTPQAELGVAASLDALGKTDLAASAYQKAASQTADATVAASAKFSLARIDEAQGKLADAAKIYTEISRAYPNSSLGSEAGMRVMELNTKLPKAPVTNAPAASAPINLSK